MPGKVALTGFDGLVICIRAFLLISVVGIAACGGNTEQNPSVLVIEHVTVIDGTGSPPIEDATVTIVEGRIRDLGLSSEVRIPSGAHVFDGTGKYLIPGLWDMHTHLSKARASALGLFVANGVTGVRDMGGDHQELLGWRAAVNAGDLIGPSIVMAGPYLESTENVERMRDTPIDEMVEPVERTRVPVLTPDDAARIVDSLAAIGVDFLKIRTYSSIETYRAIAVAASNAGLGLAGHVFFLPIEEVIGSGQRGIEHYFYPPLDELDETERRKLFRRLAQNGVGVVPTLLNFPFSAFVPDSVVEVVLEDSDGIVERRRRYLSHYLVTDWREQALERDPEIREILEAVYASTLRDLRTMREERVLIMPGTDVAILMIFPGWSLHDELLLFVHELGMTPMEAIESATRVPAEFLGLSDSMGTVEPGKVADLVVIQSNPLADITSTRHIEAVVRRGKLLDRVAIDELLRQVEQADDLQVNDWPRVVRE